MNPERYRRACELLARAFELPPGERPDYIRAECGDDAELFLEASSLLAYAVDGEADNPASRFAHAPVDEPEAALSGSRVGRFEVIDELGRGGMGIVWRAHDPVLDRAVAIKFLPPALARSPLARERFLSEARAASALDHANIATIYDFGESEGKSFIALRLVKGETVAQHRGQGPIATEIALRVASDVAHALAHAHERGILHRDVSAGNVMITPEGRGVLLDFGLAASAGDARGSARRGGTPNYIAPEVAAGASPDERSDIFALGVVLYEMLTGRYPLEARDDTETSAQPSTPAIVDKTRPGELLPGFPLDLEKVVRRAIAADPGERPVSAAAFANELESVLHGLKATAGTKRRPGSPGWIAIAVAGIAGAIALASYLNGPSRNSHVQRAPVFDPDDKMFVIAVAPFVGTTDADEEERVLMHSLVYRELQGAFSGDTAVTVIETDPSRIPRTEKDAYDLAMSVGATMLVWGEVTALRNEVEIQPYIAMAKPVFGRGTGSMTPFSRPVDRMADVLDADLSQPNQISLRRMSATDTRDACLLLAASYYLYSDRNPQRALDVVDRVSTHGSRELVLRSQIFRSENDYVAAESLAVAAVDADPESPVVYIALADVYSATKRLAEAADVCRIAVEKQPNRVHSLGVYAQFLMRLDRLDEALEWLNRAIAIDPRTPSLRKVAGQAYWAKGDKESAEAAFRATIALDSLWAEPHLLLGRLYLYGGSPEKAAPELEKAIQLLPSSMNRAQRHFLGYAYQLMGRYDEAIDNYMQVLTQNPCSWGTRTNVGHVLFQLRRFEEAATVYGEVLPENCNSAPQRELDPYFQLLRFLARCQTGDCDSAMRDLKTFAATITDDEWYPRLVRYYIGGVAEKKILSEVPEKPETNEERGKVCEAYYFLGMAHLLGIPASGAEAIADTASAVACFERVVQTGPEDVNEYMYALGELKWLGAQQ